MDRRAQGFGVAVSIMLIFNLVLGGVFHMTVLSLWTWVFTALWSPYVVTRSYFINRRLNDAMAKSETPFAPSMGFHAKL